MSEPDVSWMPKIKDTKILTIRNDAEVGLWSGLVTQCVPIFNEKIMKAMKYDLVTEGKANVIVKVAGAGKDDPKLGATATHGIARRWKGNRGIEEAEIYLPAQPWQSHKNVLLMILMHEMAHAAGLEDHANDGIFMTLPNIDNNGKISATKGGKSMPPYFFSNKTVIRMRAIW
ncbi:MAG TPA: hypothetical protein VGQ55_15940 [Pyrinomonadaceae bacterium]|jgi:hypothetical protein|nr:hypothetical protein [Pyrinomonadaceae bacterium]